MSDCHYGDYCMLPRELINARRACARVTRVHGYLFADLSTAGRRLDNWNALIVIAGVNERVSWSMS